MVGALGEPSVVGALGEPTVVGALGEPTVVGALGEPTVVGALADSSVAGTAWALLLAAAADDAAEAAARGSRATDVSRDCRCATAELNGMSNPVPFAEKASRLFAMRSRCRVADSLSHTPSSARSASDSRTRFANAPRKGSARRRGAIPQASAPHREADREAAYHAVPACDPSATGAAHAPD